MAPATPAFFCWLYHTKLPFCIRIFSDSPLCLECSAPNLPLGCPMDNSFGQSILIEAFFPYPAHALGYHLIALHHITLQNIVYLFNYFVSRTPSPPTHTHINRLHVSLKKSLHLSCTRYVSCAFSEYLSNKWSLYIFCLLVQVDL